MTLFPSPSPYDDATRQALVGLANQLTLDVLALSLATWRAHRSLRGPLFSALHPLFQAFAEKLDKYADKLPEFVAMLGGQPVGTAEEIAEGTRLDPYPADVSGGLRHCAELTARIKVLAGHLVDGITEANDLGAADALDLLTKTLAGVNYYGWQIGAHLVEDQPLAEVDEDPASDRVPGG